MNMKQQERIDFLIKRTRDLQAKGVDCLQPNNLCCAGTASYCTCQRYKCLECRIVTRNEFCKALSQLLMEDL